MTASMVDDRLTVSVSFDPAKGYVGTHPALRPLTALSLNGLRRQVEAALMPKSAVITFSLDRAARRERDQRRALARPTQQSRI